MSAHASPKFRYLAASTALAIIAAFLVSLTPNVSRALDYSRSWFRRPASQELPSHIEGNPLKVQMIENDQYVLSAICTLQYTVGTNPVVLHGQYKDGTFRPAVTYEVATMDKSEWRTVADTSNEANADTAIISPDNPGIRLSVSLQPFRPTIGVYRYGRLVLENGAAAILAIEDLLPTRGAHGDDDDFKDDVTQTDNDKKDHGFARRWIAEEAAIFNSVTSYGGRIVGDFSYLARGRRNVELTGTRTLDGDFWPTVKFEAAGSDHIWKNAGQPKHEGSPETVEIPSGKSKNVRVLLSDFKPLVGNFKYGKIIFSNGTSTVFLIDLLEP